VLRRTTPTFTMATSSSNESDLGRDVHCQRGRQQELHQPASTTSARNVQAILDDRTLLQRYANIQSNGVRPKDRLSFQRELFRDLAQTYHTLLSRCAISKH
jgi:hypothetical protein